MNINKLGKKLELTRSGLFLFGFKKNTYVSVTNLSRRFVVRMRFPFAIDEEDKKMIELWRKFGYANGIIYPNESIFDVEIYFIENSLSKKYKKVNEVIQAISEYVYEKNPYAKPQCCGDDCLVNEGLSIYKYKYNVNPFPMCPTCASRYQAFLDLEYEKEREKPNKYLPGIIGALLFSIPCAILTILASYKSKFLILMGVCFYFFTQLGFKLFKGKLNTLGTVLVSIISMIYTLAGTCMGYILAIMKVLKSNFLYENLNRNELFNHAVNLIKMEQDVKGEFMLFIILSALLCGVCIVNGIVLSRRRPTLKKVI